MLIDPLHKWRLNLNNNIHTSLASHSCENSFVLKHECEAKDVPSMVIQLLVLGFCVTSSQEQVMKDVLADVIYF